LTNASYLAAGTLAKPVDFRKGADGLAAIVQQGLSADPSGAI
jgi:hypothetical protein